MALTKIKTGILLVSLLFCFSCSHKTFIAYTYNEEVEKSILQGIKDLQRLNASEKITGLYAVVSSDIETRIILNGQARVQKPIKSLIDKSSRVIIVGDTLEIPVLFYSDLTSRDAKNEGLYALPFTGYTIVLDRNRNLKEVSLQY